MIQHWQTNGRFDLGCAIIGSGAVAHRLRDQQPVGVRVVGTFAIGQLSAVKRTVQSNQVQRIIVALSPTTATDVHDVLEELNALPVDLLFFPPKFTENPIATQPLLTSSDYPLLKIRRRPLGDTDLFLKRSEDVVLAALAIVMVAPLLLLIAVVVKLESPGPVIFRQQRRGYAESIIVVPKFRTMYIEHTDIDGRHLTTRNDPRVTRVGQLLRRTSLDELPQIFAVLRGDMSVVGPRPHPLQAKAGGILYCETTRDYFKRYRMKPGITGWAQVNGWRGNTDTVEKLRNRLQYDIFYIENWSILNDLKITIKTPLCLLDQKNAY